MDAKRICQSFEYYAYFQEHQDDPKYTKDLENFGSKIVAFHCNDESPLNSIISLKALCQINNKKIDLFKALSIYSFIYTAIFTNITNKMNISGGLTRDQYIGSKNRTRMKKILMAEIARENLERFAHKRSYVHYIKFFQELGLLETNKHVYLINDQKNIYRNHCRQYIIKSLVPIFTQYDIACKKLKDNERTKSINEFTKESFHFTVPKEQVTEKRKTYLSRIVKLFSYRHKSKLNYDNIKFNQKITKARKYLLLKHFDKILNPKTTDFNEYKQSIESSFISIQTQDTNIKRIETNNVITIRDPFGYRYHNTYTQLERNVRSYLNADNEDIVEVDIQKSQLACIVPMIRSQMLLHKDKIKFNHEFSKFAKEEILEIEKERDMNSERGKLKYKLMCQQSKFKKIPLTSHTNFVPTLEKELDKFVSMLQENTILKEILKRANIKIQDPNFVKKMIFAILYGKLSYYANEYELNSIYESDINTIKEWGLSEQTYLNYKISLYDAFKELFPSILICLSFQKKGGYKDLVKTLQRIESAMLSDSLKELDKLKIPYTSIHDAILVKRSDANKVMEIVNSNLKKHNIPTSCSIKENDKDHILVLKNQFLDNKTTEQNETFKQLLKEGSKFGSASEPSCDLKIGDLSQSCGDLVKPNMPSNESVNKHTNKTVMFSYENIGCYASIITFLNRVKYNSSFNTIKQEFTCGIYKIVNSHSINELNGLTFGYINSQIKNLIRGLIKRYVKSKFKKIICESKSVGNFRNIWITFIGYNYDKKVQKTLNLRTVSTLKPELVNTS